DSDVEKVSETSGMQENEIGNDNEQSIHMEENIRSSDPFNIYELDRVINEDTQTSRFCNVAITSDSVRINDYSTSTAPVIRKIHYKYLLDRFSSSKPLSPPIPKYQIPVCLLFFRPDDNLCPDASLGSLANIGSTS
ncbi:hypothetical protein Tco_1341163, partial [Tanacetum coccineum]